MTAVPSFRIALASVALASTALLGACGDDNPVQPLTPAAVTAVKGSGQTVAVGTMFPDSLAVLVATSDGKPVSGVQVQWSISNGGGTLSTPTSVTDAAGKSAIAYTAGTTAGAAKVTATVSGVAPLEFALTLTPASPSVMSAPVNDTTTVSVGTPPPALQVKVVDSYGNPIAGATVQWAVTEGEAGDVLGATSSMTDVNGIAAVMFTPDATTGARVITASTANGVSIPLTVIVMPVGAP